MIWRIFSTTEFFELPFCFCNHIVSLNIYICVPGLIKMAQGYQLCSTSGSNIITHWNTLLQAGNATRPTYLPMEVSLLCLFVSLLQDIPDLFTCYYNVLLMQVCNIAKGQRYSSKLNEHQVRNILRLACERPAEREERTLGVNTVNNPICDYTFYFLVHMFFSYSHY